jgi:hypothetical protein
MIDPTLPVFPNNIVEVLALACEAYIDPEVDPMKRVKVLRRPIVPTDPVQCIGISGQLWTPNDQSFEMPSVEPTLQTYSVKIQCFVKDMEEKRGLAAHSVLSKLVRNMVYRNANLRLALAALNDTTGSAVERLQRYGVRSQDYISGEVPAGTFMYLSTLDTYFETETT